MAPIKLYVGPDYKEPKLFTTIELMFPFWGITAKESSPHVRAAALQYQYSKDDFTLVERIGDADYVVMPYPYERLKAVTPERVKMIEEEARRAGKPLLVDGAGDIEHPITTPNTFVFRIGQFEYSKKPNEITVPSWAEDLLESYCNGELRIRQKSERPSVGFAGWASIPFKTRVRTFLKELPVTLAQLVDPKRGVEHKGVFFRACALKGLSQNPRIETRFKARPTYSGHEKTVTGSVADNRKEFVENLLGSDYSLCVRGDPNSSLRFYETLAVGRIPLFLDTACVLPLQDRINYRDFCVFVDWRDIDRMGDILADFHATCTPERFEDMQRKARDAFKNYLRIDGFSKQLASVLRGFITKAPVVTS